MHKLIKTLLTGVFLIILGALLSGSAFALMGFDLSSLYMTGHVSRRYDIDDDFSSITIKGDTENIRLKRSEDGSAYVICTERKDHAHNVHADGSTLTVTDTSEWQLELNLFFEQLDITLYLPEKEYEDLIISCDTGSVTIPEGFLFKNIDVKTDTGSIHLNSRASGQIKLVTDTGNVELKDVCCSELISSGDTGNVTLNNVITSGDWTISRSTGNINFTDCDAAGLNITTDTGNIKGTLLSPKTFEAKTDTGKVNVPDSSGDGLCVLKSSLGTINVSIK